MVSRFTLDSASEFLFGHDVKSLSAGLPYPKVPSAPIQALAPYHPANILAHAFSQVQSAAAKRVRYGGLWPFFELSGDKTKEDMKIIDAFIEPIISDAVEKAKSRDGQLAEARTDEDERSADTLLSHLVRMTAGTWAQ